MDVRRHIEVSGIVQGVGFRPYIYRLATERDLAGSISNSASGVTIEIQGPHAAVEDFVFRLPKEAPPLACITHVAVADLPCNGDRDFHIVASRRGDAVHTLISPDVAICDDCLREMMDPQNRRYRYPFINCTNCGPRFTIVKDIPYDRAYTSMSIFPMCAECRAEYDDPLNRRFHAQPNACWSCGPQLQFLDRNGRLVHTRDPITETVKAIEAGMIVAIKGLGGFHLAADATNRAAVMLLRERKRRVEKPFAVMVRDADAAAQFCNVDDDARAVLQSLQRPIVLLPKKPGGGICEDVAPFNRYLGVFLPYTPLHHLLFAEGGFSALVMTSGNLSEEPIAIDNQEALNRLGSLADCFLVHNRDILLRCDDSVVRRITGKTRQIRRSRGFVPIPIFLKQELPTILAVGGELKNTICLTQGKNAFLSQHIGDLENLESYKFFEEAVAHLTKILDIQPRVVAYDLHPDYFSTQWAKRQTGLQLVGIQHHHAHIASCMAENNLEGPVIGFAMDGTGYGTDGQIWGGEVLIADYAGFDRAAHFEYVPMPGGAAAIREPWRMAVSFLYRIWGREFLDLKIPFVRQLDRSKIELLLTMIDRQVNSPMTSSCGRLFDAVAALLGIRSAVNYEAQAAIELEMCTSDADEDQAYPVTIRGTPEGSIIETTSLIRAIVEDITAGVPAGVISARFHSSLAAAFANIAMAIRQRTGLQRVCLSGGTFNNAYLLEKLTSRLESLGFQVFSHSEVPAGDGGLSLGQALVAAHSSPLASPDRSVAQHASLLSGQSDRASVT
ncbi:MAG TPA: carbamoyltransferase HypF [Terriglobales bacterium]|nr:carbamoyltransferase HypF [Terriglobales bacterium]